jgi:hypothetical protein
MMVLSTEQAEGVSFIRSLKPWESNELSQACKRFLKGDAHALDAFPALRDRCRWAVDLLSGEPGVLDRIMRGPGERKVSKGHGPAYCRYVGGQSSEECDFCGKRLNNWIYGYVNDPLYFCSAKCQDDAVKPSALVRAIMIPFLWLAVAGYIVFVLVAAWWSFNYHLWLVRHGGG